MREIALCRRDGSVRAVALVDEDRDDVAARSWYLNNGYACTRIDGQKVYMHRFIACPEPGFEVDHINGNKLDNRGDNLRCCTRQENLENRTTVYGKSKYRGVYWYARDGIWVAQMKVRGTRHYLGRFEDEDEAGRVAAQARALAMPFTRN